MGFLDSLLAEPARKGKPLPGPSGVPILGSSAQLNAHKKVWDGFGEFHAKYGPIVGVLLGSRYCLLVNTADLIKEILVTKAASFANRPDFIRFNSIFRGDRHLSIALCDWSAKHKTHRDVLYPPLHPKSGACFQTKLVNAIDDQISMIIRMLEETAGRAASPRQELLCAIGNIFYDVTLSSKFEWDNAAFVQCTQLYHEVFTELFQGHAIDFMPWLKPFYYRRINELYELEAKLSRFTEESSRVREETFTEENFDNPRDIADVLFAHLRRQTPGDEGNLTALDVDIIIGDVIGGFPVLTNMVMWGLWMLGNEPDVQDKVHEEYKTIVGSGMPRGEHKKLLVYSEAVMHEIFRMVSSPIIPHVASEDVEVQGYHVPKDTLVMFNTCQTNFNPTDWEEPEKFKPERFIRDGNIWKPDFFFPFGTGKRACMGDGLVRHILHFIVSSLLGKFHLKLGPDTKPLDYLEARGLVLMEKEPEFIWTPRL